MVWGQFFLFFFELEFGLGEVRVGVLVGIVKRRRGGYVMDKVEVFVRGVGRMMSVSCYLQGVRMETYTYSARSCHLQQGHELARSSTST